MKIAPLLLLGLGLTLAGPLPATSAIEIRYEKVLRHAEDRSETLAEVILQNNRERFVDYTTTRGIWNRQSDRTWTSGFLPGIFWHLYEMTGKEDWRTKALHWTEGVRSRATATDNDTGFQIHDSFGHGYEIDPAVRGDYLPVLLTGAETLVEERFNETIGCFRSWDQGIANPTDLPFEVNIDQMMNLELVLWAAANGGPPEYEDHAVSHADKTWEHNVRGNGTTFHVVAYNSDGTVDYKRTHQGWTTDSTWTRGQAWAVYGYTMVYRYTGLPRMLERARIVYDAFLNGLAEADRGWVPYSDFDAPLDSRNPRDSSAAAIVASAALELYQHTGERRFLADAEAFLEDLSSPVYLTMGSSSQSILRKASEKWGEGEVGAIFADFYLLEAMQRHAAMARPAPAVTGSWKGFTVYDAGFADSAGWMGWTKTAAAPYVYNYPLESWLYVPEVTDGPTGGWVYSFHSPR